MLRGESDGRFGSKERKITMTKFLTVLMFAACLFFVTSTAIGQQTKTTMTNADVVEMIKAELPESTIILAIQETPSNFDTSPQALIQLKKQGASQKILDAMLQVKAEEGGTFIIPQQDFTDASWDGKGPKFERKPYIHLWMSRIGQIDYSISLPKAGKAVITARLSSEMADSFSTNPQDASDVILYVNGKQYETKRVIPDNGKGQNYQWQVQVKEGTNEISFAVREGLKNGLVIYQPIKIFLK